MAVAQPAGTVTLVFTDIEGSTRLLEELGVDAYRDALSTHREVVRGACAQHAGMRSIQEATRSSTHPRPQGWLSRPRTCSEPWSMLAASRRTGS